MALIKCKFLDENNVPKGREYTYGCHEEIEAGEIVTTTEGKRLVVTSTDVPLEEAEKRGDNLKYVNTIIDAEPESVILELTREPQNLIVVKQLPVIEERLRLLSDEIDTKVSSALALPCTEGNVQAVKSARADLKKVFETLEKQRIEVKNIIMNPYEQFNSVYKKYVSDKINAADATLKERIGTVESELKSKKEEEVKLYFSEYLLSKNIDFITYPEAKISITLSASLKSLKEQAKEFVDRIADDLALIETQEHKEEILVEYKRSLNCSQAITAVVQRHKAIEEQKARQAEIEAKKAAQAEAIKKVEAAAPASAIEPLEPPKQIESEKSADPIKTLAFKVTAPLSKLKELKRFLDDGGYTYE